MGERMHTPTPWKVFRATNEGRTLLGIGRADTAEGITDPRGGLWGDEDEALANAAFIVRAVNAHDDLVMALEAIKEEAANITHGSVRVRERTKNSIIAWAESALAKARGE